jgi:hypothetical protein
MTAPSRCTLRPPRGHDGASTSTVLVLVHANHKSPHPVIVRGLLAIKVSGFRSRKCVFGGPGDGFGGPDGGVLCNSNGLPLPPPAPPPGQPNSPPGTPKHTSGPKHRTL